MKSLLSFLFLLFGGTAFAQSLVVKGVLQDPQGNPLEMANVLLLNATDNSMSTYGFTDETGRFKIKADAGKSYVLRCSYLGLETLDTAFNTREGEEVNMGVITLAQQDITLAEAEVVEEMPISVVGDTIIYKAEAFTTGEERKLEDVLEQLPGFEVDENGEVKVQGKTVEKVMVEGQDFFDGDTKLATKNIPASAVDKVQVLRDYNDVNPLRGVDNDDRIALNIKLKDGKKNILFGDVSAQGGLDERYLTHANIFYYTPKASYNLIGDLNNIGLPAFTRQDYFRFSGGFRSLNSRSGSNLNVAGDDLGGAMIQNSRANEITSRFGALNFNLNPSKAWTFGGFLLANQSRTLLNSEVFRSYLTPGLPSDSIRETLTTRSDQRNTALMGKLTAAYAPNNALHIDYDGTFKVNDLEDNNFRSSSFSGLSNLLEEHTSQRPVETRHSFRAFYESNPNHISSAEGQFLYKYQDPRYDLSSNQRPFFLLPLTDTNQYELLQTRAITTQKTDLNLNHYFVLNNTNHINVLAGTSITRQAFESNMDQLYQGQVINAIDDPDYQNDVDYRLEDYFIGLRYKTKLGKLILSPGVNAHRYVYDLREDGSAFGQPLFEEYFLLPELFAKYDFRKTESLTLTYNMQAQFTDVNNFIPGIILNGYNSLFRGNTEIQNSLAHNFNLGYYNFNMFNFTNIFAGIVYNRSIDALVTASDFNSPVLRVLTPINTEGINEVASMYGSFEKRFTKWKFALSTNLSYSNTNTLIQGRPNVNNSLVQVYDLSMETNFKKAPNAEVGFRYINNQYDGGNVQNTFVTNRPYVNVEVPFLKSFLFTAEYAFNNYQNNGQTTNNFDFLTANLYYRQEDSPWEFSLNGMNLLNTGILREDAFNENLISTSVYYVMPRYVLLGVKYEL